MKRLFFLCLLLTMASCSSQPDSSEIAAWQTQLTESREILANADTAAIRKLIDETDAWLSGFRSGQFHDTLSLQEGQLLDSALLEKNFLESAPGAFKTAQLQLESQLRALPALKRTIDRHAGTVSERNKLLGTVGKDVAELTAHTKELSEKTVFSYRNLLRHRAAIGEIATRYFGEQQPFP